MPHPRLLSDLQITELVKERVKNATPYRLLGGIFGISGSSAYNYYKKYGKNTDIANAVDKQPKSTVGKVYDKELEAEISSWQNWFEQAETSQPPISPSESYQRKQDNISHGHSDVDKRDNARVEVYTTPSGLEPSRIFSSPSGKKKILGQMGISSK